MILVLDLKMDNFKIELSIKIKRREL